MRPLDAEFARIEALKDKKEIAGQIARFNQIGVTAPYTPGVHQDAKDSSKYVFDLRQDGLGMPDRDYYLQRDEKMAEARKQYGLYVEKMLTLAGDKIAAKDGKDIVALETELAKVQWTKVQNRDPVKTYNKVKFAKLAALAPGYMTGRCISRTPVWRARRTIWWSASRVTSAASTSCCKRRRCRYGKLISDGTC